MLVSERTCISPLLVVARCARPLRLVAYGVITPSYSLGVVWRRRCVVPSLEISTNPSS